MTIYLDNAASTPVDPAVVEAMLPHLRGGGGNPAAAHAPGRAAAAVVEAARADIAAVIGAQPREIVCTAGASEANNLAVLGAAAFHREAPGHIVTVATEHASVLEPVRALEARGWRVTRLPVDEYGRIEPEAVAAALRPDTALVSVMQVNNETGVTQDLAAIGRAVRAHGAGFHVDAAQGAGKLELDVETVGADLVSLSAHKIHGPTGSGALYVRARPAVRLAAVLHGGGHEGGWRPGTPATHQIVGMAAALSLAAERRGTEQPGIAALRDRLWSRLVALDGVHRNGHALYCAPGILNVSFQDVHGEALHAGLAGAGLAVASGSACASAGTDSSYVLRALGRSARLAAASVRFSLGRFSTAAEVDAAGDIVVREVQRLRAMAPVHRGAVEAA